MNRIKLGYWSSFAGFLSRKMFNVLWMLFFLQIAGPGFGQVASARGPDNPITISGNVSDDGGIPVPGATVQVIHTSKGIITDARGNFTLKIHPGDSVMISSLGYISQQKTIESGAALNIVLVKQDNALADAVVVGYGSQKRANLTGAVETVNMEQLEDIPASNMSAFLRYSDKLTGVHIAGGESRPGEAGTITIRNPPEGGKNGGSNGPLYVIDDVVRTESDFNLLDPSVVESISVIKDGTAAIYGARAAQGVILVTTKTGKKGPASINYTSSYGASDAASFPKMMTGYELATYYNDELITRGRDSTDAGFYASDELDYFKKHPYNWLDMAWKSSLTSRQSLTVSGGSDNATYFAGASYYYGDGNLEGIGYKKWNFQASSNFRLANHLSLGLAVNGTVSSRKWFFLKQGGENPEKDVMNLLRTPQFIPPYIRGLAVQPPGNSNRDEGLHFFEAQKLDNYTLSREAIINVNANLKYEFPFTKGLTANLVYNKNYNNGWNKQFGTFYTTYNFSMLGSHHHIYGGDVISTVRLKNGDRVRISPDYTEAYQFNVNLNYDRQFGKHHINVVALMEQAQSYYETVSAEKDGVADVGVDYMNAAFGAMTTTNSASESGSLSYAGRVNYTYNDKYIAEFDWRYDASTNFAPDYRWGFFPSISAAWILSNENFFKKNGAINFLKLRGSVGLMGRDRTAAWSWFQGYNYQPGGHGAVFGGNSDMTNAVQLGNLPNPAVHWDNINKYNFGIDAITLNNHLDINFDGYFSHGYNLLSTLSGSVPLTVGSTMPAENYATVNAMGLELSVSWNGKIGDDFRYTITTGAGYDNSRDIKVDVAKGDIGTWKDITGTWTRNRGDQGYIYEGMFRSREDVDAYLKTHPGYTIFGEVPQPGMLYYKDIRGPIQEDGQYSGPDGKITEEDMTWIHPKRGISNGGVSFVLKWKRLQAHIKTNFSIGSENFVPGQAMAHVKTGVSGPSIWANHWTQSNIDAKYPATYYEDTYNILSAFWLENSSAFSVSLIDLSYNLGEKLAGKLGVKSARFYLTVTNPIDFHNKIFDYNLTYPTLRTAVLGISINL